MKEAEREWLKGNATLGAATKWTPDEIRLVTELGYGLAEQGRVAEAIVLFEGLAALSPATVYFQAALGALWLREEQYKKAVTYLNQVIQIEPRNVVSLVNRGEALMRMNEKDAASRDFQAAINYSNFSGVIQINIAETSVEGKCIVRARALLTSIEKQFV